MDLIECWHRLIGESLGGIGWAEMSVRAIIVFLYGLALTRIAGWRAFGKWSPPDIIVAIIVGSNLSRTLTGPAPLFATLVATTVFVAAYWIVAQLASRSPGFDWMAKGEAVMLVRNGQVDRKAMRTYAISERDMDEAMRERGLHSLDRVERAFLERNGKISILPLR